jgi:hypothetical protein
MQTLTTTVLPTDEPVTLAEAKTHLRIDHNDEDQLIQLWIRAAREYAESYTGRRFVTQTVTVKLDGFPNATGDYDFIGTDGPILLDGFGPGDLSTVGADTVITYYDLTGTLQTLSSTLYQTDYTENPPVLAPIPYGLWPYTQIGRLKPVSISVKTGTTQGLVSPSVKEAILLTLTYWDENRGGEDKASSVNKGMPSSAQRLLDVRWTGAYV